MASTSINPNLDTIALQNFQEYLRIPSVHPNVNYEPCIEFLKNQAKSLELPPPRIYYCFPNKPTVVLTWTGQEPSLPSILLNSHMDVVPVFENKWTHPPFGAEIDEHKNIYARGSQDMKSVGIQFLEAIRRLKADGVSLKRTVHLSFVADEEVGAAQGMKAFIKTDDFKNLNIGFSWDEGIASESDEFTFFNGERVIWQMCFHCPGHAGHGSLLHDNTAGEKVNILLNKLFAYRKLEKDKLKNNPSLNIGDVLTLNLTVLEGGVQVNVVPPEFRLKVDCRIPVTEDFKKLEETFNQWCKDVGEGVWIEFLEKEPLVPVTKIDDSNPYWVSFKRATDRLNLKLKNQIFVGASDSRYIRKLGIPAIGFSPMNNTPLLLHDNDEYLNQDVFLNGINIFKEILNELGNTPNTNA